MGRHVIISHHEHVIRLQLANHPFRCPPKTPLPFLLKARLAPLQNVSGEVTEVDKQKDWMLLQERGIFENIIQPASDPNASGLLQKKLENFVKAEERLPIGLVHDAEGVSDEGWLSDGTESWASASSRDLSWNPSCDGADDVPASILCEGRNINPTNNCDGQGERGWGATDQAADAACPDIANRCDDANANISEKQSDAEFNDEITSCDKKACIPEIKPLRDGQTSAPALAPPSSVHLTKVQFGMHSLPEPHAGELETRCFGRYKSLSSGGRANNLTKSGSSTCMETASHTKQARLKSRHSAAVEDNYPSSFLHGHFRFAEQDDSPCYSFSVHDSDTVFFARACQPESESNAEGHDCLYTFHSRRDQGKTKGGWKSWPKEERLAPSLVGKLKVSNAKHMRAEDICTEETHFVLYGENSQLPPENEDYKNDQISGQLDSKILKRVSSKFSKPTLDSHLLKSKERDDCRVSMPAVTASQGVIGSCMHEGISRDYMSRHGSTNFVAVNIARRSNHSIVKQVIPTTQMELAAIVITTTVKEYNVTRKKIYESSCKDGDGWGAAFLEKGLKKSREAGFQGKSSLASEEDQQLIVAGQSAFKSDTERLQECTHPKSQPLSNEKLTQKMNCSKCEQPNMAVDVVVILPAGNHGLRRHDGARPTEDRGPCGPTSLLERWQSGGSCHCCGWDMGCGLSVLKAVTLELHKTRATIALTNRDRINWITPEKPLQIFTQGWKQKRLLMLEIIQAGIFSLSFQARLSPLQAFATAVAIFHEQITHEGAIPSDRASLF